MNELRCPDCGAKMLPRDGKFGPFFSCIRWPDCSGKHGAHKSTGQPFGIPGDAETRRARTAAHAAFDKLWQHADEEAAVWKLPQPKRDKALRRIRCEARESAYCWLAVHLGLAAADCHIGNFSADVCEQVVELCEARLAAVPLP